MKQYKEMISIYDYKGSFGAAIGDIYGSFYEFQKGPKTPKEKIRIHDTSTYTGDTVLTAAVACYMKDRDLEMAKCLQCFARNHPRAGYGGRFAYWIWQDDPKPYNSCGNGSAMRISSVSYYVDSLEEAERLAEEVSMPTHNHKEGIKGAKVIAGCIYLALHNASRKQIEEYASRYYDLDLDYEAMMAYLGIGEKICQVTVPQAIWAFLHSDSFEDCLRLCLSIRWDADTMAAIACPIAEAYYKEIPLELLEEARKSLPYDLKEVLESISKEKINER